MQLKKRTKDEERRAAIGTGMAGGAPAEEGTSSADEDEGDESTPLTVLNRSPPPPADARFDQPAPAPWKRAALVIFTVFLFWLAFNMRFAVKNKPAVVHAHTYVSS